MILTPLSHTKAALAPQFARHRNFQETTHRDQARRYASKDPQQHPKDVHLIICSSEYAFNLRSVEIFFAIAR